MINVSENCKRWGLLWRPYHGNMRQVDDFFTKRNLWAISCYLDGIDRNPFNQEIMDYLKFILTGIILGLSKMNRYRPDVSFPLNYSANTLYIPPIGTEEELWHHIENKFKKLMKGIQNVK